MAVFKAPSDSFRIFAVAVSTLLAPASLIPPASALDNPSRKGRFSLPSPTNILHHPKYLAAFSIFVPVALFVALAPLVILGTIGFDKSWDAYRTMDGLMGDAIAVLRNPKGTGLTGEMILGLLLAEQKVQDTGHELIVAWESVWCVYATFVVIELVVSPSFSNYRRDSLADVSVVSTGLHLRIDGVLWSTPGSDEGNSRIAVDINGLSQRRHPTVHHLPDSILLYFRPLYDALRHRQRRNYEERKCEWMCGQPQRWHDHAYEGEESRCSTEVASCGHGSIDVVERSVSRSGRHDWNYSFDGGAVSHRRLSVITVFLIDRTNADSDYSRRPRFPF